ncbi:PrsW family intramembrane metalloprotease [Marisediminicola senii]|uniref:PrsW family intramembrane metalloprotease n=1 Tax=Marisediminicola senii TaxID=2711233 RepID=UPI0013EAA2CF|nr:PrsW family intramembrane metalloprotease [Marisediminicola senii]
MSAYGPAGLDEGSTWRPVAANPHPVFADAPPAPPPAVPRRRGDPLIVLTVIGFVVVGAVAIGVAGYLLLAVGTVAAAVAFVMALVPLVIVVLAIRWIDRWEPEPRPALLFALLWGAAVSVAIALLFSVGVQVVQMVAGVGPSAMADVVSAVVQAPIVEEVAKGLGLLILFWAFRRGFDGPVDGLVYAATIAVGFAFTENIQYFGLALLSSGVGGVSEIFFLRGILSPFAHVMFTSCIGIAVGLAARRTGAIGVLGYFVLGLIPAIALHAFWNGASFVVTNFYAYYVVVQVPLFLLGIAIVVFLRRAEQRVIRDRLGEYAEVGWFTLAEVRVLSNGALRSQATAWAARQGLGAPFTRFVRDATKLAFARQRIVSGRDRIGAQVDEAELLRRITADRAALAGLPSVPAY